MEEPPEQPGDEVLLPEAEPEEIPGDEGDPKVLEEWERLDGGRIRGCGRDDQLHYGGDIDLTARNGAESRSRSDVGQVEILAVVKWFFGCILVATGCILVATGGILVANWLHFGCRWLHFGCGWLHFGCQ